MGLRPVKYERRITSLAVANWQSLVGNIFARLGSNPSIDVSRFIQPSDGIPNNDIGSKTRIQDMQYVGSDSNRNV